MAVGFPRHGQSLCPAVWRSARGRNEGKNVLFLLENTEKCLCQKEWEEKLLLVRVSVLQWGRWEGGLEPAPCPLSLPRLRAWHSSGRGAGGCLGVCPRGGGAGTRCRVPSLQKQRCRLAVCALPFCRES